jgi:predicted MPP superfamily phosphohydrolase
MTTTASTLPLPAARGRWLRAQFMRRSIEVLRVRHVDLRSRGLDLGIRMLLASDIHARDDWFPREHVARTVDAINAVDGVDIVALLGDFVGNDVSAIDWSAQEYARIVAPTAAVLGNHDHWCDAARVEQALDDVGVDVLTNRSMPLSQLVNGARENLWIAGIDSCWPRRGSTGPGADADAALTDIPHDAEVVVLGHEPYIATMHEHALHVAGHTHCGQIRTPVFGDWTARLHMPRFSNPYPCGLYELDVAPNGELPATHRTSRDRRFVYTTAGVGYSTIDVRGFCPPELVVIDA